MKRSKYISVWHAPVDIIQQIENEHDDISEVIYDSTWETFFTTIVKETVNFNGLVDVVAVCEKHDIPVTVITMSSNYNTRIFDWNKHKNVTNVNYTPWYLTKTFEVLTRINHYNYNVKKGCDILDTKACIGTPLKHLFISMNNRAHPHRCIMMDMLAKHDLIDSGVISWRDVMSKFNHIRKTLDKSIPESVLDGFQYKYWTPKRMILDFPLANRAAFEEQEFMPAQYASTFMQIVPETGVDYFFLTEKTAMPLFFNKPFLVAGCKNYHKNLVDMGYQLYDELFDYSFDNEDDFEDRAEGIASNIARYRDHTMEELQELLETVRPKLLHNRLLTMEFVFDRIPKELYDIIDRLEAQSIETFLSVVYKIKEFKQRIK